MGAPCQVSAKTGRTFATLSGVADEDYGARVRAAQAYAGLDNEAFATALGFSSRTLDRLFGGTHPLTVPEARKIADVCKVPIGFLVEGWTVNRPIQDRLTDIERQLEVLASNAEATSRQSDTEARELDQKTAEQLVDGAKQQYQAMEQLLSRLGHGAFRRGPRSRRTEDQTGPGDSEAAA